MTEPDRETIELVGPTPILPPQGRLYGSSPGAYYKAVRHDAERT